MAAWGIVFGICVISIAYLTIIAVGAIMDARSNRSVDCPADGSVAYVRTQAGRAALSVFTGDEQVVQHCSHWPGREGCDRACEKHLRP
jgi:hypothetical protein